MNERKKLSDILRGTSNEDIAKAWDETTAAAELGPLPKGEYVAEVVGGEPHKARSETPGYKITFRICEGEYTDRRVWLDLWLTPAAIRYAKRDLAKLGITRPEQMDFPPSRGIICKVRVTLRSDDDGIGRNEVRSFEVIRIEGPKPDPFAVEDAKPKGENGKPPTGKSPIGTNLFASDSDEPEEPNHSTGPYGKGV